MKSAIKQIFILPVVSFVLTLIVFLMFFNILLHNVAEKKFQQEKEHLIKVQKDFLKNEVDAVVLGIEQIRHIGYSLAYQEINILMQLIKKQKPYELMSMHTFIYKHLTDKLFYWYRYKNNIIPSGIKFSKMKVGNKIYNIVTYKNKKYLVVESKIKNGVFGIAFSLSLIKQYIKKNIFKFLDRINKGKVSYIAMGEILNWNPGKDGVFGKIIYLPNKKTEFLKGKKLSLKYADKMGKFYRKKYFYAFKKGKDAIYVSYYFKNPLSGKYELKISYFKLYKPYNWIIVKGFYYSQIENLINRNKKIILSNVKRLFLMTAVILLIISLINFVIAYIISKKIMNQIIKEYELLKNKYETSQIELIKRVYYDALTSLPNRNKLLEEIDKYKSMCLIDIDDFSDLNDIYGFDMGDEILKYLGSYLKEKYKHVYKIGSDEFAVGFKYKVPVSEIREIVNFNLFYSGIKITLSVGASYVKGKLFETAETALKLAYKDKNVKYKIYDESMQEKQKERLVKIQQLSKILENEDVIPYYQCIVDTKGNPVKYEALMRIKYNNKILSPFHFMEFIKEAKLYNKFSRLMIKKVFQDIKYLDKPVSINLSFIDISNTETKNLIMELLEKNQDASIVFEVLETENIEQFDLVVDFITHVKKYGVKIAIDDFGSGYSNLVNILYLKPDYLKIDASLVKNLDNPMYLEIIRFIVGFAKKFGIKTTAEFVSDEIKFSVLKEIGVDEFQGFYFCEPASLNEIKNNLLK